jgi:hypothetical protein
MEMTSRDRKALIVLGAVALVAVVLFMFVLHKGGSSETVAPPAPAPTGTGTTVPTTIPEPTPSPTATPDTSIDQPSPGSVRDPFEELVAIGGSTGSTDTSGGGTTVITSPSPEPTVAPSPAPSPTVSGGSTATIEHGGHTVTLVGFDKVGSDKVAIVDIDGTKYTVKVNDTIAYDFQLMGINEPCADFVHVTHPFTLCVVAS